MFQLIVLPTLPGGGLGEHAHAGELGFAVLEVALPDVQLLHHLFHLARVLRRGEARLHGGRLLDRRYAFAKAQGGQALRLLAGWPI